MRETLAVLPGDGWRAVYAVEGAAPDADATEQMTHVRIVAFGLMLDFEIDEDPQMVGLVPEGNSIVPCVSPTFVGYLHADGQLSDLLPDLELWREAQAREAEAEALEAEILGEQLKSASPKFSDSGLTGPN